MSNSSAIFVLGMHRSGTSVVTKLLELMSVYVGEEDELLPPSPDNPKGFFERKDVLTANQAIFKHHRCNWYTIGNYDTPCAPLPDAVTAEIKRITAHMSRHPRWAIKDPRLCFTLPYWLAHIDNPVIVTVSRNPAEIVQSLLLRNDIEFEQGFKLWQAYIEHGLKNIGTYRRIACDYGDIINNPFKAANDLFDALNKHITTLTPPDKNAIQQFVSPSLRRAVHRNEITYDQQSLYDRWRVPQ